MPPSDVLGPVEAGCGWPDGGAATNRWRGRARRDGIDKPARCPRCPCGANGSGACPARPSTSGGAAREGPKIRRLQQSRRRASCLSPTYGLGAEARTPCSCPTVPRRRSGRRQEARQSSRDGARGVGLRASARPTAIALWDLSRDSTAAGNRRGQGIADRDCRALSTLVAESRPGECRQSGANGACTCAVAGQQRQTLDMARSLHWGGTLSIAGSAA